MLTLNDFIQNSLETQWNQRKENLKGSIITDKELDDITREELLADIRQAGIPGSGGVIPGYQLDMLESLFAKSKVDQSEKMLNRRVVSNLQKEKKERPGLMAQTILTQNVQGGSSGGSGGGGSIIT